jgi:hypothetical protein
VLIHCGSIFWGGGGSWGVCVCPMLSCPPRSSLQVVLASAGSLFPVCCFGSLFFSGVFTSRHGACSSAACFSRSPPGANPSRLTLGGEGAEHRWRG